MNLFVRFIIFWSFRLQGSVFYKKLKKGLYALLEDEQSIRKRRLDAFMMGLVVLSVFSLVYSVKNHSMAILWFDLAILWIFIVEFLLRMWVSFDRHVIILEELERSEIDGEPFILQKALKKIAILQWEFLFSPMSIIDLLAILPSISTDPTLKGFLVFRLMKIFRYIPSVRSFMGVILEKKFELSILLVLVIFDILFASIAMYIFEGGTGRGNPNLITFFDAVYWSVVTIATVGYGDIVPISHEGRIVAIVLIMSGIAMIAFTTSIVTSALTEKMAAIKEERHRHRAWRMKECVVVCGFGRIGRHIMEQLTHNRVSCIVLEKNPLRVEEAREFGYTALCIDATHTEELLKAGLGKGGRTVVCAADKDLTNLYIALTARSINDDMQIIAKANDIAIAKKFELVGVNHTVSMYELSTFIAAEYLGKPVAFEAIEEIVLSNENVQIDEITVRYKGNLKVNQFFSSDDGVILIGIWRHGEFMFNPSNDEIIYDHDVFIVMGRASSIAKVGAKIFAQGKQS